jgi:hypothetical protein
MMRIFAAIFSLLLACRVGLAQTVDPVQKPIPTDTSTRVQWDPVIGPVRIGVGAAFGTGLYAGYGFPVGIPDTVPKSRTTIGIPCFVGLWLRPQYSIFGAALGFDAVIPAGGTDDYMKHSSFSRLNAGLEMHLLPPGHIITFSPRIGYSWLHESLRISRLAADAQGNVTLWEGSSSYRGVDLGASSMISFSRKIYGNLNVSSCSTTPKYLLWDIALRYRPGKKDAMPVWYGVGYAYCLVGGAIKYRMLSLQIGM